jgi:hypothetical protein
VRECVSNCAPRVSTFGLQQHALAVGAVLPLRHQEWPPAGVGSGGPIPRSPPPAAGPPGPAGVGASARAAHRVRCRSRPGHRPGRRRAMSALRQRAADSEGGCGPDGGPVYPPGRPSLRFRNCVFRAGSGISATSGSWTGVKVPPRAVLPRELDDAGFPLCRNLDSGPLRLRFPSPIRPLLDHQQSREPHPNRPRSGPQLSARVVAPPCAAAPPAASAMAAAGRRTTHSPAPARGKTHPPCCDGRPAARSPCRG